MSHQVSAAFDDLIVRVRRLVGTGERRVLLGVTGSPGAGKTTLVQALAAALRPDPPAGLTPGEWVAHVPMDGFHLADVELQRLGRGSRKGAPDTFDAHGYLALLRRLRADEPSIVYAPAFERGLEQPLAGAVPLAPAARLVLTEGNYLLLDADPWPHVAGELDEVWFCALNDETRRTRLVARHVAFGKEPTFAAGWVRDVDEQNAQLIAASWSRADLIVPSAVLNSVGAPESGRPKAGDPLT
ncbi:MAG: putative fructose transport system kinase [Marmoricola sp.]|nr:putative fructose transport system kinase [Marmoricola sp.]